jgi:Fungal N-terminal domain of STAND proteins
MDPLSITTGCVTLVATIAKLTVQINGFVREARGARSDLDAVSRELHSLTTVLEILAHDADDTARSAFPPSLAQQITGIVKNCGGVVSQIEASLEKHGGEFARLRKGAQWSWGGKFDMEQLRSSLEAHKSALDIALQMVEM